MTTTDSVLSLHLDAAPVTTITGSRADIEGLRAACDVALSGGTGRLETFNGQDHRVLVNVKPAE